MEREGGIAFIESLAELLRRLMDYRAVQQGDRDLHMHVMFNLLVSLLHSYLYHCNLYQYILDKCMTGALSPSRAYALHAILEALCSSLLLDNHVFILQLTVAPSINIAKYFELVSGT